jgi:hypothetical protein
MADEEVSIYTQGRKKESKEGAEEWKMKKGWKGGKKGKKNAPGKAPNRTCSGAQVI